MPQSPIVRKRQKARHTKKLAAWREKQAAASQGAKPTKAAASKKKDS